MRTFELLLILANLLAFLNFVVPQLRAHWMGLPLIAPVALLLAIIQVLVEGPRWQMAPAYALTTIFFMIWLLGIVIPGGIPANRFISVLGMVGGFLALIIAFALPVVLPVFHFPKPGGPYAIGTVTYHWVDTSRPELFTPDPNDHRELMVQVWYPAKSEPSAPRAPYIQDADAVTPVLARLTHFPGFFFAQFRYVTTNAVTAAPVADNQASYPVLIYLTGLDGFRSVSMFQIEALVSNGYVVVGIDQPGAVAMVRFPEGRQIYGWPKNEINPLIDQSVDPQPEAPELYGKPMPDGIIPYFAQDASFVLDQLAALNTADPNHILTGRLNLARAGTFGISLGGMNAAQACLKDARFKACLIMDVWIPTDVVKSGLQQPTMFITRDAGTMRLERQRSGGWAERDIIGTLTTMHEVYESLPADGYYLSIPTMFHINFTDAPYWSPFTSQFGLTGPIDGQRGFDIINAYSIAFFDRYLKGRPSPLLEGPSQQYPEVHFESRRP